MSRSVPVSVKSKVISIIILVAVGLIFPIVLIELAARIAPGLIPTEIQTVFQNEEDQLLKGLAPDDDLGYKYAPGLVDFLVPFEGDEGPQSYAVTTTSLGYAGSGFRDDGLEGDAYAVVIGDSYANCASVALDECWVELLEKGIGRDFANLGVVGYSPQQELRMLTKYGLPLKPELVVWTFFPNDVNDAWRFDQFGRGAATAGKFWQQPLRAWLAQNSVVYATLSFFWYNRYLFYNLWQADDRLIPRDSNLIWWLTYTDLTVPEVAEGFALTTTAIGQAYQQVQAMDERARFVVVIIPFREQVYADPALQPQLDRLNQALVEYGRRHGIPVLDLTPALRQATEGESAPLYFRRDIHLTRRGNELVAELLRQNLAINSDE
jgi:hypothetical protein